jgi:hypothetical protein
MTMPLISRQEKNSVGDPSTLSLNMPFQYLKNILKKFSIQEKFSQSSHQQEHLSSVFPNIMAENYDSVWTSEDSIGSPISIDGYSL